MSATGQATIPHSLVLCMLVVLSPATATLTGCQPPLRQDKRPYALALGLLEPRGGLRAVRPPERSKLKRRGQAKRLRRRVRSLPPLPRESSARRAARFAIVRAALAQLGKRFDGSRPKATRLLLAAVFGAGSADKLAGSTAGLARRARPGDIVVFDQAHDKNGNQRLDDQRSDRGIVVSAHGARVGFVYLSGSRVRRGVLHLRLPNRRRWRGRVLNSYVRVKTPRDPLRTRYLAGELLAGFAPAPK